MLTTDTAIMLAKYSDWADQILFEAIKKLPDGAVYRKRKTLFDTMLGTLNHNYQVDLIWKAHLRGEPHGFTSRRDLLHPEFDALIKAQTETNRWYIDWAKRQDGDSLSERGKFTFISGKVAEMSKGGMFLHIVTHKSYHRGWVAEMFFEVDARPPAMDLCVFLTEP